MDVAGPGAEAAMEPSFRWENDPGKRRISSPGQRHRPPGRPGIRQAADAERLLSPSPWVRVCFFILLFLKVTVKTYYGHLVPQAAAALWLVFEAVIKLSEPFPGLVFALVTMGAALGPLRGATSPAGTGKNWRRRGRTNMRPRMLTQVD